MVLSLQTIYRACKCSIIPTVIVILDYMGEMPSQQWMLNKLALKKRNKMICEKINFHLLLKNNNTEEQLKVNGNFLIKFLNRCVVLHKNPKIQFCVDKKSSFVLLDSSVKRRVTVRRLVIKATNHARHFPITWFSIRFWLFRFCSVFGYYPTFHTLTSVGRKVLSVC